MVPKYVKEATKVVGYFSHTSSNVFCDGDACIIAGSEKLMRIYLEKIVGPNSKDKIKKTRFGEIIGGLRLGGAYAFDEESYGRFLQLAEMNKIEGLPTKEFFSEVTTPIHFIRIQFFKS